MLPVAVALLPALAAAPTDADPPHLSVTDLAFGTVASDTSAFPFNGHLGLVPGHRVRFAVDDDQPAGRVAFLVVGPGLAPVPIPLDPSGTVFLQLDPTWLLLHGSAPLDPVSGQAAFDLSIPATLPVGLSLATQAATVDVHTLVLETSNPLTHVVTDLAPVVVFENKKSAHPNSNVPGALLVSNQVEWEAFWAAQFGAGTLPPLPAVDFSTQVVVVGFGGQFAMLSHSVVIDALAPHPRGGLAVHQTVVGPGPGCSGGFFAEGHPVQVVAVDRVAGAQPVISISVEGQGPPCD